MPQWFESEVERTALLSKARAVVDATASINLTPRDAEAKTRGRARRAGQAAAPAYLRGRVAKNMALPSVKVVLGQGRRRRREEEVGEEEKERWEVCVSTC